MGIRGLVLWLLSWLSQVLGFSGSQALLPGGCLTDALQLPAFPIGWDFVWEGTLGSAQGEAGLAEAGSSFFGWPRGNRLWDRGLPFF